MAVSKRTKEICALLDSMYGTKMRTYLEYEEPWQLLFSTIMSAQCTDERVNNLLKILFYLNYHQINLILLHIH